MNTINFILTLLLTIPVVIGAGLGQLYQLFLSKIKLQRKQEGYFVN